jgi:hypothetical protein
LDLFSWPGELMLLPLCSGDQVVRPPRGAAAAKSAETTVIDIDHIMGTDGTAQSVDPFAIRDAPKRVKEKKKKKEKTCP